MSNSARARYESALARAHRAVWQAQEAARDLGMEDGEGQHLYGLLEPLQAMLEDSLAGRRRRARRPAGQVSLYELLPTSVDADAGSRSGAGE